MSGLNASDKGGTPLKTPRTDWPTTARTPDNIQKVKECLAKNRRVAVRTIAEEVRIGRDLIVTQDLGKRKLCYRLVPHTLRSEQMQLRLDACGDLTDMTDRDPNFLKPIVTGDETWCLRYDPEGKCHSIKWRGPGSPESKKARSEKSHIKTMHVVFFDSEGLVNTEFLLEGTTLNASTYVEILKRLLQRIKRVRPQYAKQGDWTLLHDNARPHTAFLVQKFLDKRKFVSLNHPPYSPDLSLLDFFLFPKLKSALKGQMFSHISDIQRNVTTQLKAIPKDCYTKSFQDLHSRSQKYITIDGNYFEEQ
ncbi:Mariner Mos1 transposase [Araneus ventricosus]|uniref:Mariner Mos1 transposase n=1 Tax=Araneus ventricosus TaxID=182803 RepID=A0A4Y2MFS2_ARAVE|nr:Mariner Mos1 transposase [Araneus ventricosus]